jgi:hypothetical protein
MAPPTPQQLRLRARVEAVIRVAAPALDLLLAAGDRVSRLGPPDNVEPARLPPPEERVVAAAPPEARLRS